MNLNFEQSVITSSSPSGGGYNYGTANVAGWTEYDGWGDVNYSGGCTLQYNSLPMDSAGVSLLDTNFWNPAIQGNYSLLLKGPTPIAILVYPWMTNGASIGQTGTIPVGSASLVFYGSIAGTMQLTFNGQPLNYVETGSTANYGIYTADISPYAGQTGQLLFTQGIGGSSLIDNIQFLSTPVPEPGILALLAVGGLLLGYRRRKSS